MKTMKTIAALLTVIISGTTAMATGNLRVNVGNTDADVAMVEISNLTESTFEIDVRDEYGDLIFFKKTQEPSTSYKRNYDFSALEDGIYSLSVSVGNETTHTRFRIDEGMIRVVNETKMVRPVFLFEDNALKLTYLNFAGEKVGLYVYDRSNQELYKKDLKSDFAIHHGLDFSKLPRGKYEVVLASGNEVYDYQVNID